MTKNKSSLKDAKFQKPKIQKRSLKIFMVWILIWVIWVGGFWSSEMGLVVFHENVHAQIFESYNSSSKTHYDFLRITGWTEGDSSKCGDLCVLAHNQNEIVGYTAQGILTALWIMLGVCLLTIFIFTKILGVYK